MGIGNQNFYVIEEFIGRGILKEETFAISRILVVLVLRLTRQFLTSIKAQKKALQVTFIHTIHTNKSTSSNFYLYNIHKQKHLK